jgi:hypothetical protein
MGERTIIFRGKRTDNGEWIEGYYVHQYGADMIYIPDEVCREYGFESYHIIPETVSEFTSLYDKNGKRIFEGDVVKNIDGAFLVCWDKEKCAFIMRFLEYPYETLYLEEMWEDSEVIGNIHDNPELLKGGAE